MKKPKLVKPAVKIPKYSLIVKDSVHRVKMSYRVSLDLKTNKDIDEMINWCAATFKTDTWRTTRSSWPGYIYFVHEHDAFMCRLRWG